MTDYDEFNERLDYDENTGVLTWRSVEEVCRNSRRFNKKFAGKVAGGPDDRGYLKFSLKTKRGEGKFYCHRVAWLLHYGEWPNGFIDHIDGNTSNNRLANLRVTNTAGNARNSSRSVHNTSGYTGVSWDTSRDKWFVSIGVNYRTIPLGRFDNLEDAVEARKKAEKHYGFHENHGRFVP